ncbi:class D sortase [Halobacillus shinanisalinarum]|uniref:Class D sortase n=1 Tax=Halobacillus shinanisalinarum TaxID=2932258 RepID=A0ABY4H435_9BACI|nr:class D sortase [Halobacillus shinanisalinarum]UOQ94670.1 class D sortase [Halobacillus shinanisalinarum]
MKYVAMALILIGLSFAGWNAFLWWQGTQSVSEIESSTSTKSVQAKEKETTESEPRSDNPIQTLSYNHDKGENIAKLKIPSINQQFEVFWGTGEDTLDKGVGMYVSKWTSVPNKEKGHTVLSGHRDTVFTELGNVEEGDIMTTVYDGEEYKYSVDKIWITDADDRTVIVKKDQPTLTLTTCYPFDYIGDAPDRYIIQGHLVK